MNALIASLPDDLIANIASFVIKPKPTLMERRLRLWGKFCDIYYSNDEKNEWMRKVEKNPRFYGYRSFKLCKKIIKYQVVGEITAKLYHLRIEDWTTSYAENRILQNINHTMERLEGCANKPNRIILYSSWYTIGIW